ncbi:MAG: hypothetical protein PVH55_03980, partial [Desulfobacterales bacterium]
MITRYVFWACKDLVKDRRQRPELNDLSSTVICCHASRFEKSCFGNHPSGGGASPITPISFLL